MPEKVSSVCMRELVATVAGPNEWSDNRKSLIAKAARQAGITFRQAKALFYGEITDPNHRSARLMRDAAERKAKTEATRLAEQFETIARSLGAVDQDFHRDTIAALISGARTLRGAADAEGHEGD